MLSAARANGGLRRNFMVDTELLRFFRRKASGRCHFGGAGKKCMGSFHALSGLLPCATLAPHL